MDDYGIVVKGALNLKKGRKKQKNRNSGSREETSQKKQKQFHEEDSPVVVNLKQETNADDHGSDHFEAEDKSEDEGRLRGKDETIGEDKEKDKTEDKDKMEGEVQTSNVEDDEVNELVARVMSNPELTESEKRVVLVRLRREQLSRGKGPASTHRQKMAEFNEKLSKLSEHFDIPKVGPG